MKEFDVVIIGGGASGLASAVSCHDKGIKNILIIEKESYLGGILLQCIHNGFGLHKFKTELCGPEYANRYIEEVNIRNIEFLVDTFVESISKDKIITYYSKSDGLVKIKAKSIVCTTGCSERTREAINIPGSRPSGIYTAGLAQKYINIEGYFVGKRIFILGSGDIGLIMARRMKLEGADVLGVAEIMPYSNGLKRNIVLCLEDFNIPLYLSHTIKEIIGDKRLEKIIVSKVDKNKQFIKGSEFTIDVDCLLLSVGLIPSNPLLEKIGVEMDLVTSGPIVDEYNQTSVDGVFCCGNSLQVHDLVDYVSFEGEVTAGGVYKYLTNQISSTNQIKVIPGKNISYVIPQYIKQEEKTKISFRVKSPLENIVIKVYQNNILIKSIKKQYIYPSVMEILTIDNFNNGEIVIDIEEF